MTIFQVIQRLFPHGTKLRVDRRGPPTWDAPLWGPDAFAVCATLIEVSGCYHLPRYAMQGSKDCVFTKEYRQEVVDAGEKWSQGNASKARQFWNVIWRNRDLEVSNLSHECTDALMKLLGAADEACAGVGFSPKASPIAAYIAREHRRGLPNFVKTQLQLPESICWMVSKSEVCVQPKAQTALVGCTMRSLSHHLSLLPGAGQVRTAWLYGNPADDSRERSVNFLLVPFPFGLDGGCVVNDTSVTKTGPPHFFALCQNWLKEGRRKLKPSELATFFAQLVRQAERHVQHVDAVVLPETALAGNEVADVAMLVAKKTDIELFISGTFIEGLRNQAAQNQIYGAIYRSHQFVTHWVQPKHHRWRLDGDQICRYHFGDYLNPRQVWWESIALPPRTCTFYAFMDGASLAALVCEDLARIDPAQVALRAVGPNLVVALLMDGPQIATRWPARYATVLADDPGCAVLTLTSAGMIRRSVRPGDHVPDQIALWKDSSGSAQELKLPRDAHGLVITLSKSWEEDFVWDGRSDNRTTVRLILSGVREVRHPTPPAWIR
jgi:hypothetical protein